MEVQVFDVSKEASIGAVRQWKIALFRGRPQRMSKYGKS